MVKMFEIKDFPGYFVTKDGDIYSKYTKYKYHKNKGIIKMKFTKKDGYNILLIG